MLITVAVYWPVWFAQFLCVDDQLYVTDNPVIQQGLTWNGLIWAFSAPRIANYHPLALISHMLDCQFFGVDPRWHHAINLAFHCLNVVLVYLVLRSMTGRNRCSAVVAAVFAIHPLHVESVAWVSERKDVLSAMFFFLTLAAWTWYVRHGGVWRFVTALSLFALGLLSKPMLVTLPALLLLLDIWPLGRTRWAPAESLRTDEDPRTRSWRFLIAEKIPFAMLAAGCALMTMFAQADYGAVVSSSQGPLSMRLGNVAVSYVRYVRNFLWPANLSAFYPMMRPWPMTTVLAAALLLLAMTATLLWLSRQRPYLGIGWLWFVGMLVPVIGLVQVGNQAMADRYMYLPLVGLAIIVAWIGAELLPKIGRRRGMALASLVLLSFAALCSQEVRWWHSSDVLFARAIEQTEPNVFALENLGSALMQRGDTAPAIACLDQCVRLQPGNPAVHRIMGLALVKEKRYKEAAVQLAAAMRIDPKDPLNWNSLGHLYLDQKDYRGAVDHFGIALDLNPQDYNSRLGRAAANEELGHSQLALNDFQEAIKLKPRIAESWYMYGTALLQFDQPQAAIAPLHRATTLDPRLADAQYRLGLALMRSGRGELAIAPLMTAVNLAPSSPEPMSKLAWLLATYPDAKLRSGSDAVYLANRANELVKSSPRFLSVLAAAYAEQKQFDRAAKTASDAAEMADATGDIALRTSMQAAAAQYRAGEPTRDPTLAGADASDAIP